MLLARSISKHDVVEICRELNSKFGEKYSFCPTKNGIKCKKWPGKRDLDEITPKHLWYGVPYVKQFWFPSNQWPSMIPSDWNEAWWNNHSDIVYVHTDNEKLRWDSTMWDGAEWTFNQKVMIASTLLKLKIIKKKK